MANHPRTTRADWIEAGYELVRLNGLDGVRVDCTAVTVDDQPGGSVYFRPGQQEQQL